MGSLSKRTVARALSVGLMGFGGLLLWFAFQSDAPIRVEPAAFEVGTIAAGETSPATYRLSNRGPSTVHILGARVSCGETGCGMGAPTNLPLEIPPGKTREVAIQFHANGPRQISYAWQLFSDAPGQSEIELLIEGTTVAAARHRYPPRNQRRLGNPKDLPHHGNQLTHSHKVHPAFTEKWLLDRIVRRAQVD